MHESPSTPSWSGESLTPGASPTPLQPSASETVPLWLGPLLLVGAAFWLYLPTAQWLWNRWRIDEYYAHGPLLPFISGYLIWQKKDVLARLWAQRPQSGLCPPAVIFIALAMQILGSLVDMNIVRALQAFSIPLLLLGVALYLGGKNFAKELLFPLLFLFMAVPLSGPMVETFTLPLQSYAAATSAMVLGLLGMPIERDGVNLYTPLYHFVVAVPCSGLKIAITLFTMGLLIAHLMPRLTFWQRIGLCLLSLPIALVANTLRVMTIITLGYNFGTQVAEGFLHNWSGLFMFSIALGLLIAIGTYFGRQSLPNLSNKRAGAT